MISYHSTKKKNMTKNKASKTDFLVRCSVCESDLDPRRTIILEEKDQKTTAHITCPKCNSAAMVFLSNNQAGVLSIGIATDLDESEVRDKFGKLAISADEMLDLYEFISNEKGGIAKLINS